MLKCALGTSFSLWPASGGAVQIHISETGLDPLKLLLWAVLKA